MTRPGFALQRFDHPRSGNPSVIAADSLTSSRASPSATNPAATSPAATGPPAGPPYRAYATLLATYLGGVAATGLAVRRLGREPPERAALDLLLLGLATFKGARTLARDEVTSFLREPFVEGRPSTPSAERPVANGAWRQAIGELVTCSRCVGTWVAAGVAATDVLAPRFGRLLTWSLALGGANDWLRAGFATLADAANRVSTD